MGTEIPDWPDEDEGEGPPPGGFEIEIHDEGMEVMLDEDMLNNGHEAERFPEVVGSCNFGKQDEMFEEGLEV